MLQLQKFLSKANFNYYPNVYAVIDNNDLVKAFYSLNEAVNFRNQYFGSKEIFFTYKDGNKFIEVINENNIINYFLYNNLIILFYIIIMIILLFLLDNDYKYRYR
jgi:spore cortex formation protein SpoVR/YcgB (stage V sporulation)